MNKKKTYAEKVISLERKVTNALQEKKAVGMYFAGFYGAGQFNLVVDEKSNEKVKVIRLLNVEKIVQNEDGRFVNTCTSWYAAFDMNAIEPHSEVTLEVPKDKAGLFAGKGQWQLRKWCKMLDVAYINVVGV